MTHDVAIYIFDDVEVLDFAGPYEVFTTASRVAARRLPGCTPVFRVRTLAARQAPVRARAGLVVVPDAAIAAEERIDVLIVPGGVVEREQANPDVIAWIARTAARTGVTASVCTGAFLLAAAGLLAGRRVTTHWEDRDELQRQFPELTVLADVPWVDEGAIVTSAGISAGIDMSLHLVARLAGAELAAATARQMEYRWQG